MSSARDHWLIPPEPGCQLAVQPMSILSPAQQGTGCGLIEASTKRDRLHISSAENHVQDQTPCMPTTTLLRNTISIRAAEHASVWYPWQHFTIAGHQMQVQDVPLCSAAGQSSSPGFFHP